MVWKFSITDKYLAPNGTRTPDRLTNIEFYTVFEPYMLHMASHLTIRSMNRSTTRRIQQWCFSLRDLLHPLPPSEHTAISELRIDRSVHYNSIITIRANECKQFYQILIFC